MQLNRERLILLHESCALPRRLLRNMIDLDPSLESFFELSSAELGEKLSISTTTAKKLYQVLRNVNQESFPASKEKHIKIITCFDSHYPSYLKHIPDYPLVLYAIGNLHLLHEHPSLSVIGTRKPSEEAYEKTKYIITPLIKQGFIIVSGLAYGIDRFAHEITLENDGKTIAVLGSGFHHIYPQAHIPLANRIVKNGLLLSEYPPFMRAKRWFFPERNRIISGLTDATLVIEAMERSGTFITVDQALEQGKDVFAVPGSIFNRQTAGCHLLIKEGAIIATCAENILENLCNRI